MMKKLNPRRFLKALATFALLLLTACAPFAYGGIGIEVGGPPPGVHAEVHVTSPGPGYVWVPGYWDWNSSDWVWVPGAWLKPPHPHAHWVAPHYQHRRGHWKYHRGHWR
jgi:WXXGXW repeat (2 copies)